MNQLRSFKVSIFVTLFILLFAIPNIIFAQSPVDLVVHYVEGTPAKNEIAYDVNVYFSVVDGLANSVKNITIDSLTVTEDSRQVQVSNLALIKDEPINIVLAMDVSGSMSGMGIASAKIAASNFISRLGSEDRVAVITFDDSVKTQIDFTTDHTAARNQISLVDAMRGAGTCLNDAAFQAIQMVSTLPPGRRAVILFTDGVDETSTGEVCSTHTFDDVIKIASDGGTRTPIYSLSMGGRIDENTLKRMANLTGGRYLSSPDSTQVDAIFSRLSDQLRYQYILTYKSKTGPGPHTLAVSFNNSSSQDSDTRSFLLPAMPTRIEFISPIEGSNVNGDLKVAVAVSGSSESIARVTFDIGGNEVGMDLTSPYEININLDAFESGNLTLSAIAYASNNTEFARSSIIINHFKAITENVDSIPTPNLIDLGSKKNNNNPQIVSISIVSLFVITTIIFAFFIIRRRNQEIPREQVLVEDHSFDFVKTYVGDSVEDYRSVDNPKVDAEAFGSLVVESSDDSSMIGHRFDITTSLTTMGRSVDNDIIFPKDNPVSRHHAEISEKKGALYLMEISLTDISGSLKPPTFGTFINNIQLGPTPVLLQDGDVIGLGKRVRLKFETSRIASNIDVKTYDELDSINDSEEL